MATITKRVLSGSSDGYPLVISATGNTATLMHAITTSTTTLDEIWAYASNSATTTVSIAVVVGPNGNGASQTLFFDIPGKGSPPELILAGLCLQGNSLSHCITMGASTANCITITGFVNRIVQS